MIHVFCGENSRSSRQEFLKFRDSLKEKGYAHQDIPATSVPSLLDYETTPAMLFSEKIAYTTLGIEKIPFRKSLKIKKDSFFESLKQIHAHKDLILLSWESDKPARLLKMKDCCIVHESKLDSTIFSFMDMCSPGKRNQFIQTLQLLSESEEEVFILIMLLRHVRTLFRIKTNSLLEAVPPWQKAKLITQANSWAEDKLTQFYQGLMRLEIGTKTSSNPYGIKKSLEILACLYL